MLIGALGLGQPTLPTRAEGRNRRQFTSKMTKKTIKEKDPLIYVAILGLCGSTMLVFSAHWFWSKHPGHQKVLGTDSPKEARSPPGLGVLILPYPAVRYQKPLLHNVIASALLCNWHMLPPMLPMLPTMLPPISPAAHSLSLLTLALLLSGCRWVR